MFAFFGLGTQEILLLGVLGVLMAAVALIVVLGVTRRSGREAALEAENRRLRADRDRDRPPA